MTSIGNNFKVLADDFIYLKDFNFNEKKMRGELISFSQLSNSLGIENEIIFIEEGKNLEFELEVNYIF